MEHPEKYPLKSKFINKKTVQNIMKSAVKNAGIIKNATVHTLRHSFATHFSKI
ncbi:tyrosine-type recombinase/integrase [Candidatus Poribacteria bacterium]|nr:tyrosine-type recombinase/integrase [Candidatus Poribacteria bacterium]